MSDDIKRLDCSLLLYSECEHDDGCGRRKHSDNFDLPLFFDMSKQFLAPGGLSADCVQVSVMLTLALQGAGSEAPKA